MTEGNGPGTVRLQHRGSELNRLQARVLEGRKVIQRVVERVRSYRPPPDKVKAGSVSKERSELFYLPQLVLVRSRASQFRFLLAMALSCHAS